MAKKPVVADAWDDDWETQADSSALQEEETEPAPMTKAERLARHEESNRKLWESAESPQETLQFINPTAGGAAVGSSSGNNSSIPMTANFKPVMKVLSRKPTPKMVSRTDPVTGLAQLTLEDDNDGEDERAALPTPEEIRMRQLRELEEKQRRYEEARAKIFGESAPSSGSSTPGNVTPPQQFSDGGGGAGAGGRQNYRGRGRGRGGRRNDNFYNHGRHDSAERRMMGGGQSGGTRELYDPSYSPKPGPIGQRRGGDSSSPYPGRSATPREEDQVIRAPRGPDGSGRGGFGFTRRGTSTG